VDQIEGIHEGDDGDMVENSRNRLNRKLATLFKKSDDVYIHKRKGQFYDKLKDLEPIQREEELEARPRRPMHN